MLPPYHITPPAFTTAESHYTCQLVYMWGVMYNIIYPFLQHQWSLDRYIISFPLWHHLFALPLVSNTCALINTQDYLIHHLISFLMPPVCTTTRSRCTRRLVHLWVSHEFVPHESGDAFSPCLTDTTHIPFPRSHYKPDSHSRAAAFYCNKNVHLELGLGVEYCVACGWLGAGVSCAHLCCGVGVSTACVLSSGFLSRNSRSGWLTSIMADGWHIWSEYDLYQTDDSSLIQITGVNAAVARSPRWTKCTQPVMS